MLLTSSLELTLHQTELKLTSVYNKKDNIQ